MTESTRAILALDYEKRTTIVNMMEWVLNESENLAKFRNKLNIHWDEYHSTTYMPCTLGASGTHRRRPIAQYLTGTRMTWPLGLIGS